ncbi:radical SAM protein [bacterium]|nr:radical SAM protein [bacterium]
MRLLQWFRSIRRIRAGMIDDPRFLTFTVTYSCNARCIMCDSWKIPSPDDLTLSEIGRIFDQLPQLDAVRLTGGEPFVRRDLLDICHLAQRKLNPLVIHVTTNGFLTDRIVEFCEKRRKDRPLQLLISVDGVGEKHNQVRGTKNAWDHVVRTIKALAPRRKELRISLAVNQTIVDGEGAEHYKQLREFLKPLGIRNQMVMAYDVSATYSTERDIEVAPTEIGQFSTFGSFDRQDLVRLLDEVEQDLKAYSLPEGIAKRYYLRGIRNRILHGIGVPNPPCVALRSHLRIFPNGDVPTCQFNSRIVGNLRQQQFRELWTSALANEQRHWVRKCPGCWAECEVLPSAIYSADLLRQSLFPSDQTTKKKVVVTDIQ